MANSLAIISSGTVNDFASYLKLPSSSEVERFCEMIRNFKLKEVDAGKINDEYFINVIAGGILTDIAYKVPKDRKAIFGKLAYYMEGALELPKQFFEEQMKLEYEVNGELHEEEVSLFIVANSRSVGGFKDAAPMASVSDGRLDILIMKKVEFYQVSDLLFKFLQGEHPQHECIEYMQTDEFKAWLKAYIQSRKIDFASIVSQMFLEGAESESNENPDDGVYVKQKYLSRSVYKSH